MAIRALSDLNKRFYESSWQGFSATRGSAWAGWHELAGRLEASAQIHLLDIACGNLRFERFLAEALPATRIIARAIDSCDDLALSQLAAMPANASVSVDHLDVIETLMGEERAVISPQGASYDLAVSFGFMHHVPGFELRLRLLHLMAAALTPDGLLAVSFWRFMDDGDLAGRALQTTERAQEELGDLHLEQGDYILGWNGERGAYRYCHHFDDVEIDALVERVGEGGTSLELLARYRADGRNGGLNEYLVFRGIRS